MFRVNDQGLTDYLYLHQFHNRPLTFDKIAERRVWKLTFEDVYGASCSGLCCVFVAQKLVSAGVLIGLR